MHQKIKFPLDGKVATIEAETNILVTCMNVTPEGIDYTHRNIAKAWCEHELIRINFKKFS